MRSDASYENHNYLGRESVMSVPMSQQIHHPSQNYTNGTVTGYPHYNPAAHYFLQNQIHHLNKPPEHSTESPTTGNTPQAASANQESQHKTDSAKPPTLPEYRQPMVDEREVESSNENPDALREQNQEPKSERTESPGLSSERTDESKESRTEHSESRPEEPVESEQRPTRPTQENQTHSISKVPSSSEPGKPDPGFRFEGPTPSFEDLKESYKTEPPSNIAPYTSSPLVNSERGYPGPPPLRSFSPPTSTPSSSYSPFNHLPLRPISSEAGLHPKTDFRPDSRSSDSQSDISQSTSVPTTPTTSIPYLSPGTPQRLLGFPTTPTPPGIGRLDHSAPLLGSSEAHQNTNGNSKDIFFCHLCSYVGNSKYLFNAHMNTHFEHRCPQCDYTSRTEGRLKRHIKDFHSESPPDSFSGNKTMRSDASPAAMEAPPLDSSSPSPNGTPQSQQQQPGRPKVFKCKQCNYSTVIKTEFWEHSRSHIKEDKVLQCPKCPFVTEYKHHLEYHLRNHFGSKPFKCPKCNYACVNKSMLNSHMKSHTNVYQYRCADCTYATKYCHSLKLHLKKYNHKPATVLNPDGSLPVDGSGDFELVSKRGPPRGPRGPRKDSKSPPAPGMGPSIVLPNQGIPSPRAAAAAINGMMMPNFSPFMNPFMSPMANGMHPVQPMMPPMMSGLSPLNIQVPPEHHRLMQQSMMSGDMPQEKSPAHGSAVNKDIKCVLCSFKAENRVALNQHMFKVHAAENQDLFNMFGIPQEQLMEEAAKAAEMASAAAHAAALQARPLIITPKLERDDASEYSKAHSMDKPEEAQKDREHANHSPSQLDEQTQTWLRALQATGGIPSREMLAQMRQMHFNPQSMAKHLTAKERYNMALATDMAASIEAETKVNGEHPLDLTKPQHHPGLEHPPGELERLEYMVRAQKRSLPSDESSMSPGSQANQSDPATPAPSTSPTPRKRSRKGKAYKLDTICMKLQERYGDEEEAPQGDGLTESDDYNSEAGGEREEESKDGSDAENDGKEPNINYNEIHNSLRELNSDSENSQQKYPGEGEQVSAVEGAEMPRLSTPPKSSESGTIFSNTINRRKLFMMRHAEEQVQEALRSQLEQNGRDAMMKIGHMNLSLAAVNPQLAKNGDTYECTHCDILFRDCIMYTVHMGYHGYQDPFKCNMCGNLSKNRVEFFLHIARAAHD